MSTQTIPAPFNADEARAALSTATQTGDDNSAALLRGLLLLDQQGMIDWTPLTQSPTPARTAAPEPVSLLDRPLEPPRWDEPRPGGPAELGTVAVIGDRTEIPADARPWIRDQLARIMTRLAAVHSTATAQLPVDDDIADWTRTAAHHARIQPVKPILRTTTDCDAAIVIWDGRLSGTPYTAVVSLMATGHPVIRLDPATQTVSSRGNWTT